MKNGISSNDMNKHIKGYITKSIEYNQMTNEKLRMKNNLNQSQEK